MTYIQNRTGFSFPSFFREIYIRTCVLYKHIRLILHVKNIVNSEGACQTRTAEVEPLKFG